MSSSAISLSPYSSEEFLSAESFAFADEAVASVFTMMLGVPIQPAPESYSPVSETSGRTAIVGFSGTMRGSCELQLSSAAACSVTSAMLGGSPVEDDDGSINDAVGELCNMIAGGWKNRPDSLAATCALSPPTVISGGDYKIHVKPSAAKLKRTYIFDGNLLQLTLHYFEPKGSAAG